MTREVKLVAAGVVLIVAGTYEAVLGNLGWPALTDLGKRKKAVAAAGIAWLAWHVLSDEP